MRRPSRSRPRPGAVQVRLAAAALVAGFAGAAAIVGCGSRGPLDDNVFIVVDAASEATVSPNPDAAPDTGASSLRDSGLFEAGTIGACGVCVVETCTPTILQCLQTPACVSVFQCVATKCLAPTVRDGGASSASSSGGLGGLGGLSPVCLLGCVGQDPQGALELIGILRCLTSDCGKDCGSLLGGLGNLGGLGGLGGGGGRREEDPIDRGAFMEVFGRWPELFTPREP